MTASNINTAIQIINFFIIVGLAIFLIVQVHRKWVFSIVTLCLKYKISSGIYFIIYLIIASILGFYVCKFLYNSLSDLVTYFDGKTYDFHQQFKYNYEEAERLAAPYKVYRNIATQWSLGLPAIISFVLFMLLVMPGTVIDETISNREKKAALKKGYDAKTWADKDKLAERFKKKEDGEF